MRIAEREVTFRRCGRCEAQTWETADGPLPLGHVLDLARVKYAAAAFLSRDCPPGTLTRWWRRRT